ncbi:unnamed protein product [Rhodiola kirilowii]
MPSNTEIIASHDTAIEDTLATVVTTMECMTKSMDEMQQAFRELQNRPDRRPDKQPLNSNPPLLATPTSQQTIDNPNIHLNPIFQGSHSQDHDNPTNPFEPYTRHPRTPRLEVRIFTGEGVEGWLFQMDRFFTLHETPPDQMLAVARLFMTGEALLWYQWKHITGQVNTWFQLFADLRRRFGPTDY